MSEPVRVLVVVSMFYPDIAETLREGACRFLEERGVKYDRVDVPGALEVSAAIRFACESKAAYDGYVALGCVVRGETSHYEIVAGESARALTDLNVRYGLAIGNGILTVETRDQAHARAQDGGAHAARACLALVELKRKFQ